MLKIGTKFCHLVHDQNFHGIIVCEAELSQYGEGLGKCSLETTCPMTDDMWYSEWFFAIQRIPWCRCQKLNWNDSIAEKMLSTEFSTSVEIRTLDIWNNVLAILQLSVDNYHFARHDIILQSSIVPDWRELSEVVAAVRSMDSSSTSASVVSSTRSSSSVKSDSLRATTTKFSSDVTSSSLAESCNLFVNCISWLEASSYITVFSKMTNSSLCNGASLAIVSFRICSVIVKKLVHIWTRLITGRLESSLDPVSICRISQSSQVLKYSLRSSVSGEKKKSFFRIGQDQDVKSTSFVLSCT